MIIEKMEGDGVYEDFIVQDSSIIIGDDQFDLSELQRDDQNIFDIKKDDRYVASIIIPPAQYDEIDAEDKAMQEVDGSVVPVKRPLDMNAVRIVLWVKPLELNQKQGE